MTWAFSRKVKAGALDRKEKSVMIVTRIKRARDGAMQELPKTHRLVFLAGLTELVLSIAVQCSPLLSW